MNELTLLAQTIRGAKAKTPLPPPKAGELTRATVVSVNSDSTVTVNLAGTTVDVIAYALSGDSFTAGETVWVTVTDEQILIYGMEATSASTRFARTLMPPRTWNVGEFGAKNDASTDDTDSVVAADRAAAEHGGGTVWFPPGAGFRLTRTVGPSAGVTWEGQRRRSLLHLDPQASYDGHFLVMTNHSALHDLGFVGGNGSSCRVHRRLDAIGLASEDGEHEVELRGVHFQRWNGWAVDMAPRRLWIDGMTADGCAQGVRIRTRPDGHPGAVWMHSLSIEGLEGGDACLIDGAANVHVTNLSASIPFGPGAALRLRGAARHVVVDGLFAAASPHCAGIIAEPDEAGAEPSFCDVRGHVQGGEVGIDVAAGRHLGIEASIAGCNSRSVRVSGGTALSFQVRTESDLEHDIEVTDPESTVAFRHPVLGSTCSAAYWLLPAANKVSVSDQLLVGTATETWSEGHGPAQA